MFRIRRFVVVAAAVALGGIGAVTAVMASSHGALFSPQKSVDIAAGQQIQGYSDVDMDWNLSGTITSTGMVTHSHEDDDFEWGWGMSGTMTSTKSFTQSNKVALAISMQFSVPLTSVVDLHSSGWGYGEIYKLYEFAQLTGKTPGEIQAMRTSGLGWGQIAQELGIKVNGGKVISGSKWFSGTVTGDLEDKGDHHNLGSIVSGRQWLSGTEKQGDQSEDKGWMKLQNTNGSAANNNNQGNNSSATKTFNPKVRVNSEGDTDDSQTNSRNESSTSRQNGSRNKRP